MNRTLVVRLLALTLVAGPVTASSQDIDADRFLEQHLEALGGREALARITSRRSEGALERHGRSVPIVSYARSPNLQRVETRFPKPGTLVQGFDGTTAWVQHPLQGVRRLEAAESAAMAAQTSLHPALHVTERFPIRHARGTESRDGKTLVVLAVGRDAEHLETWRFDAATARLVEIERRESMGPHGEVPVTVRFEDHRTVDGVVIPFVVHTRVPLFETVLRLETVRHNLALDDTLFAVPADGGTR